MKPHKVVRGKGKVMGLYTRQQVQAIIDDANDKLQGAHNAHNELAAKLTTARGVVASAAEHLAKMAATLAEFAAEGQPATDPATDAAAVEETGIGAADAVPAPAIITNLEIHPHPSDPINFVEIAFEIPSGAAWSCDIDGQRYEVNPLDDTVVHLYRNDHRERLVLISANRDGTFAHEMVVVISPTIITPPHDRVVSDSMGPR